MATHSSILAWEILWTGEPGGLQSMGWQRVGHDGVTKHSTVNCPHQTKGKGAYPLAGRFTLSCCSWVMNSYCWHPSYHAAATKSLQSCLTLCDPMDSSPPGSSVHRILQARILEWVAISFSKHLVMSLSKQTVGQMAEQREGQGPRLMKSLRHWITRQRLDLPLYLLVCEVTQISLFKQLQITASVTFSLLNHSMSDIFLKLNEMILNAFEICNILIYSISSSSK